MSKTLFNTNTFQSKTLQNSNTIDIGETNVTTFTATNATITNLVNSELQAATSGVATNATNINNKQDEITSSSRLDANLIAAGFVSNAEYTHLNGVTSSIQDQLDDKQDEITSSDRLSATLIGANGNVSNTEFGYLASVTSDIQTQIGNKQDEITSSDRLSATLIGDNGNVSNTEFGYLRLVTSDIQTQFNNTTSAVSTINTNIEGITASSDITTIDNQVIISRATIPQLLLQRPNGGDVRMKIRGKRTGSTSSRQAQLDFQNDDSGTSPNVKNMCSIVGRVTNHTDNVGGMEFISYTDGATASGALTMSRSGNFLIGGGSVFQDTYKMSIVGSLNVQASIYQIPQMTTYNFDKAIVSNDLWGNGNRQTDLDSTRTVGTAFSSHSDGFITFTQTGTYKIRASGNLQSRYNDRLAFAIYLVSLDSSNDVTTDYFENSNYNFFSWLYSRNTSDGAHGNVSFEDHIYIVSGNKIQIRNKLDINGVDFNDTLGESSLSLFLNLTITKITDQDINNP